MEKIFKNDEQVFAQFTTPDKFAQLAKLETIPEFVGYIDAIYTNKKAVCTNRGYIYTYNRLLKDTMNACAYLEEKGIKAKDHVAIYLNNSYRFIVSFLALTAHGSVAVLIPTSYKNEQVDEIMKQYDCVGMITDDVHPEDHEKVNCRKWMINEFLRETAPNVNNTYKGYNREVKPEDPAVILLTGGTTGKPKGVVLSHTALMRGVINGALGLPDPFDQVYYCIIPFTHSFGLIRSMLCALYTGSLIYINYEKTNMFKELAGYKPTILCIVPALADLFLSLIRVQGPNFVGGNLHTIICGAANVPPYLVEEYARQGITLYPGYGLTEFSNLVSGNPTALQNPTSVGILFPEIEAKIVDDELLLKGRNMFSGYYKDEAATKAAMTPDGWFKTGDLAKFDDDGYLYIVGRRKDTIVLSNGKKVEPAEIESIICTLPLIQDCLVKRERSNGGGTDYIVAEVTLRPLVLKESQMDLEQAKEVVKKHVNHTNEKLPEYARVMRVDFRDKDFDRTPNMKIIRPND